MHWVSFTELFTALCFYTLRNDEESLGGVIWGHCPEAPWDGHQVFSTDNCIWGVSSPGSRRLVSEKYRRPTANLQCWPLGWAAGHSTVLIWPHDSQACYYSCCWVRGALCRQCCFEMEEGEQDAQAELILWPSTMQPASHLSVENTFLCTIYSLSLGLHFTIEKENQQIKIKDNTGISGNMKIRFYLRVLNLFLKLKYVSNSMGKTVRVLVLAARKSALFPRSFSGSEERFLVSMHCQETPGSTQHGFSSWNYGKYIGYHVILQQGLSPECVLKTTSRQAM